ncbi:hypothetical protein P9597_17870 [Aneurinibacillus migulanus]|uniref:hypothetical protein n=1 Tax=Aneurinibacillus migulanus TaxID=47500 RepID=UPI002E224ACD|nr:hypothetical protein [Aneurinibacillus migulanus]
MMNMDARQEDFAYYKEGVITWIYVHESEQENVKAGWQEHFCSVQEVRCSYGVVMERQQEEQERVVWCTALTTGTYERAETGYWDTG